VDQAALQDSENTYLAALNAKLAAGEAFPATGDWDWPAYGVQEVSAVVIGCRDVDLAAKTIEVAYLVTIFSDHPLSNYGAAMREVVAAGSYTFVQLAPSVRSTLYETLLISTYVGTNPYPMSPAPSGTAKPQVGAQPLVGSDPMPPPHPPP
jgi:hypothetical protein